jgi:hypothetical protein
MTLALKSFADGLLGSSKATLYKVQTDKTISARVTLVNTASVTVKCKIYRNPSGTSRLITPEDLELAPQEITHTKYVELEEDDEIEGEAAAADLVEYTISGIQR